VLGGCEPSADTEISPAASRIVDAFAIASSLEDRVIPVLDQKGVDRRGKLEDGGEGWFRIPVSYFR